jgi:hypothetical protein
MSSVDQLSDSISYYGYSFEKENSGGLGAALYSVMLAMHYARLNNHKFALIKEGLCLPCLNGNAFSSNFNDLPNQAEKIFHSYFKSLDVCDQNQTVAIWKSCPNSFVSDPPNNISRIKWYSDLMKEIYQLNDEIIRQVEERVKISNFNSNTDIVLHIRRSDKISGINKECDSLPLIEYVEETMRIINKFYSERKDIRVFVCTDDKNIINLLSLEFSKYKICLLHNNTESILPRELMTTPGMITKSQAFEDNIVAITNLHIMTHALYLIGGRMSYFFRVAELLRYPLPSLNIQDQEKYGKAEYAEPTEFCANLMKNGRYENFINPIYAQKRLDLTTELDKNYLITINDFMSEEAANKVKTDMPFFKDTWWVHAIRPSSNQGWDRIYLNVGDPQLQSILQIAENAFNSGEFAYHFMRTCGGHYETCYCYVCHLQKTFESYEVLKAFSNIVGKKVIGMAEIFASKYERDNFLSIHHDKNNGDYAFILSLTENWNPVHGGNTHFVDEHKSIYKTVSPKFNTLTIFKLSPDKQMDHFVSRVCCSKSRYAFTGWFHIEK